MRGLLASFRASGIVNRILTVITPRRHGNVDTDVLAEQTERQSIPPLQTFVVEGTYQDDTQTLSQIGGTDFQTLTPNVDYTFNLHEDGEGPDLINDLEVIAEIGGSGYKLQFTNTGNERGWLTYQIRGRKLITDRPLTHPVEDPASVREFQRRQQEIHFAYLNDVRAAQNLAELMVSLFAHPTAGIPQEVSWVVKDGQAIASTLAGLSMGSLIAISETMTALTTTQRLWIQSERRSYRQGNITEVVFGVFPSFAAEEEEFGAWDETNWDECLWGY
jgi:hypothetical protein